MSKKVSMYIPENLLDEAVLASGATTKTMAVVLGLKELICRKRINALRKLKGTGLVKLSQKEQKEMRVR